MLYIFTLCVISLWLITLLSKGRLSWHSIVTSYIIGVTTADFFEGLFNIVLGLYRFHTHLSTDPYLENEYGVIFADFLILPFSLIIFVHYAFRTKRPWLLSLGFALVYTVLEWSFLELGYTKYIAWSLYISAAFYIGGFRFGAYIAPRIASYKPPIPYRVRLLCFSHTILMWVSAMFSLPILKFYRFKPGLLQDYVGDCRVTELLTGDVLSVLCVIFVPILPRMLKPVALIALTFVGLFIALFFYDKGWLVYYHWSHFLMAALRYFMPLYLIMLYDSWESGFKKTPSGRTLPQ